MAEFITGIQTEEGVKQIDYNSLGNLPEWRYIGEFVAEESVNPFVVTKNQSGNDIGEFTEAMVYLTGAFFHLSSNSSINRSVGLITDLTKDHTYNPSFDVSNMGSLKVVKADSLDAVDLSSVTFNSITLHMKKVGDLATAFAANENANNSGSVMMSAYTNRGIISKTDKKPIGIQVSLGWATNLLLKGSKMKIWVK